MNITFNAKTHSEQHGGGRCWGIPEWNGYQRHKKTSRRRLPSRRVLQYLDPDLWKTPHPLGPGCNWRNSPLCRNVCLKFILPTKLEAVSQKYRYRWKNRPWNFFQRWLHHLQTLLSKVNHCEMHSPVLQYADLSKNQDIKFNASEVKVRFHVGHGDSFCFSLTWSCVRTVKMSPLGPTEVQ